MKTLAQAGGTVGAHSVLLTGHYRQLLMKFDSQLIVCTVETLCTEEGDYNTAINAD